MNMAALTINKSSHTLRNCKQSPFLTTNKTRDIGKHELLGSSTFIGISDNHVMGIPFEDVETKNTKHDPQDVFDEGRTGCHRKDAKSMFLLKCQSPYECIYSTSPTEENILPHGDILRQGPHVQNHLLHMSSDISCCALGQVSSNNSSLISHPIPKCHNSSIRCIQPSSCHPIGEKTNCDDKLPVSDSYMDENDTDKVITSRTSPCGLSNSSSSSLSSGDTSESTPSSPKFTSFSVVDILAQPTKKRSSNPNNYPRDFCDSSALPDLSPLSKHRSLSITPPLYSYSTSTGVLPLKSGMKVTMPLNSESTLSTFHCWPRTETYHDGTCHWSFGAPQYSRQQGKCE